MGYLFDLTPQRSPWETADEYNKGVHHYPKGYYTQSDQEHVCRWADCRKLWSDLLEEKKQPECPENELYIRMETTARKITQQRKRQAR